jgi:hypothetical protein
LEINMLCSHNNCRGAPKSPLIVNDLCAQLTPLNRYGLPGLGAAVADGVRLLVAAGPKALVWAIPRWQVHSTSPLS